MRIIKFLVCAVITIFLVVFCAVNRLPVSLNLFPFPYILEFPLFIFALFCVSIGVVFGGFSSWCYLRKTRRTLRNSVARMEALENEIKSLRIERENKLPAISKQI